MSGLAPFADPNILLFLLTGLVVTIEAALLGVAASLLVGILVAAARASGVRALTLPAAAYTHLTRCVPFYLVVLAAFFGVHAIGADLSPLLTIALALAVYHGALSGEIIRGGLQSVGPAQLQAARALGLGQPQALLYVVGPQAVRRIQPPLAGELVTCIKHTSLGALIGLDELLRRGEIVYQKFYNPIETLFVVAALYWLMCFSLSRSSRRGLPIRPDRCPPGLL